MKRIALLTALMLAVVASGAVIRATGTGRQKFSVKIEVGDRAYANSLKRNLELSGLFEVVPNGSIRVSGGSGAVRAEGAGKALSAPDAFTDERSARMAARRLSDAMCEAYGGQKGFACDRVLFLNRGRQQSQGAAVPSEICVGYPDGGDIASVTSDGRMTIFPRWSGRGDSILYISDKGGSPQIWEMNLTTKRRSPRWSFRGSPAGIAVSPDGSKVAAILSFQGNPELYVLQGEHFTRLTDTPNASEGQPTWSPDGRQIAYVSNETRYPQIYVIDVATRQKRRLTSRGSQNVDPDWGTNGQIAYITKRGGSQVAVMSPQTGDGEARLVTEVSNWEHPSWSRDGRHLMASRDRALFVVDTLEDGDRKPVQMFRADGNWNSPCWIK